MTAEEVAWIYPDGPKSIPAELGSAGGGGVRAGRRGPATSSDRYALRPAAGRQGRPRGGGRVRRRTGAARTAFRTRPGARNGVAVDFGLLGVRTRLLLSSTGAIRSTPNQRSQTERVDLPRTPTRPSFAPSSTATTGGAATDGRGADDTRSSVRFLGIIKATDGLHAGCRWRGASAGGHRAAPWACSWEKPKSGRLYPSRRSSARCSSTGPNWAASVSGGFIEVGPALQRDDVELACLLHEIARQAPRPCG